MTDADKIAMLEAQLELARADLSSHVQALDRKIAELRAENMALRDGRVRRMRVGPGDVVVVETGTYRYSREALERVRFGIENELPVGVNCLVLDSGFTISAVLSGREVPR